ncbi:WSD1 family O-acyltransferase [Kocuria turfanensis]|nr:WSD1 family O-acyltransferase [Kocuria turfanensis]
MPRAQRAPPWRRTGRCGRCGSCPGCPGGRLGLLLRMHHVVADGIAALALLAPLFDAAPPPASSPAPPLTSALTGAGTPAAPAGRAPRSGRWWTAPAGLVQQLRAVAREGRAPALSINRPVGRRRALALVRADLAAAKEAAHRHGGTVNDVLLAAAGGGVRAVLAARGELTPDLVLKVSVPVSVRRPGQTGGNRTGVRIVPVPLGEADPAARLARVAAGTAAQRRRPPYVPGGRLLQRWTARTMHRQRLVNLWLSNLHGPAEPLRLGGARVLELFQLGAVQGNVALAVGALSYAGRLNLGLVADADVVPDLDLFAAGVADTLDRLGAAPREA